MLRNRPWISPQGERSLSKRNKVNEENLFNVMVESFFANPLFASLIGAVSAEMEIARKSIELNVPFPGMQAQTDYLAPLNSLFDFVKTARLNPTLSRGEAIMELYMSLPSYDALKRSMILSIFHQDAHMCFFN